MNKDKAPNDRGRALRRLYLAWLRFKHSHDLNKAENTCCTKTRELWDALNEYEAWVDEAMLEFASRNPNGKGKASHN